VFAVMNFSAEPQRVTFKDGPHQGRYRDFAGGGGDGGRSDRARPGSPGATGCWLTAE
jgi:hypothetical protein